MRNKNYNYYPRIKYCIMCKQKIADADPLDSKFLRRFISSFGKISPGTRSGLCQHHQKKVAKAIKNARQLGLISY